MYETNIVHIRNVNPLIIGWIICDKFVINKELPSIEQMKSRTTVVEN